MSDEIVNFWYHAEEVRLNQANFFAFTARFLNYRTLLKTKLKSVNQKEVEGGEEQKATLRDILYKR